MAATTQCVPNQQLFNADDNFGAGLHNLTINVTTASQDQPYILDYLWLCKGNQSETSTAETGKTSKDNFLIGAVGVLGGVAVLFIAIVLGILLSRIRRKNREESDSESTLTCTLRHCDILLNSCRVR